MRKDKPIITIEELRAIYMPEKFDWSKRDKPVKPVKKRIEMPEPPIGVISKGNPQNYQPVNELEGK